MIILTDASAGIGIEAHLISKEDMALIETNTAAACICVSESNIRWLVNWQCSCAFSIKKDAMYVLPYVISFGVACTW